MFPYVPGRKPVRIMTLCVSVSLRRLCRGQLDMACRCPGKKCAGRHFPVVFVPPGKESCREEWRAIECVEQPAAAGTVEKKVEEGEGEAEVDGCDEDDGYDDVFSCEIGDLALGPIAEESSGCNGYGARDGTWGGDEMYSLLRFPHRIGEVIEVWLLCGYEVVGCYDGGDRKKLLTKVHGKREPHYGPRGGSSRRRRYFTEEIGDISIEI
jgi:hypothetical protein